MNENYADIYRISLKKSLYAESYSQSAKISFISVRLNQNCQRALSFFLVKFLSLVSPHELALANLPYLSLYDATALVRRVYADLRLTWQRLCGRRGSHCRSHENQRCKDKQNFGRAYTPACAKPLVRRWSSFFLTFLCVNPRTRTNYQKSVHYSNTHIIGWKKACIF